MTEQKKSPPAHTPGPWEAKIGKSGWYVALGQLPMAVGCGYLEANARLIAAAPELLEACEASLLELLETCDGETSTTKVLRAAITKARRRQ